MTRPTDAQLKDLLERASNFVNNVAARGTAPVPEAMPFSNELLDAANAIVLPLTAGDMADTNVTAFTVAGSALVWAIADRRPDGRVRIRRDWYITGTGTTAYHSTRYVAPETVAVVVEPAEG